MADWDFRICGYASPNYAISKGMLPGCKLVESTHKGESSAAVEIEAWKERMRRHEVSHVELIDLRIGGKLTNTNIQPWTKIGWSWEK